MPLPRQAYERYGEQIGFLAVDTEDTRSASVSLLAELEVTDANVADEDKELLRELAALRPPVTLAVPADGRVVGRQMMSAERLDATVAELAAGASPAAPTP